MAPVLGSESQPEFSCANSELENSVVSLKLCVVSFLHGSGWTHFSYRLIRQLGFPSNEHRHGPSAHLQWDIEHKEEMKPLLFQASET